MINTAYALNSYNQTKVASGNPVELIIMLYDGCIEFLGKASTGIKMQNLHIKLRSIDKALAIIQELDRSLNMEAGGQVAANLRDLYSYMMLELVQANISSDSAKLEHIAALLKELRGGWAAIKDKV